MKKLILPLVLLIVGISAGAGAGFVLRPDPAPDQLSGTGDIQEYKDTDHSTSHENPAVKAKNEPAENREFVKLNNQFVIPVVSEDRVSALVVMSLSIEIASGGSEVIYQREPKLRDALLQVLFDHANIGGFKGEFTNAGNLNVLRQTLTETAQNIIGEVVSGVLITDVARQDV